MTLMAMRISFLQICLQIDKFMAAILYFGTNHNCITRVFPFPGNLMLMLNADSVIPVLKVPSLELFDLKQPNFLHAADFLQILEDFVGHFPENHNPVEYHLHCF